MSDRKLCVEFGAERPSQAAYAAYFSGSDGSYSTYSAAVKLILDGYHTACNWKDARLSHIGVRGAARLASSNPAPDLMGLLYVAFLALIPDSRHTSVEAVRAILVRT